jgi:hypothetical protein
MQHALTLQGERARSPLALQLEARLEGKRVGPVQVTIATEAGRRCLVARVVVLAGLSKQRIADAIAEAVWRHAIGMADAPQEVRLEVADDDGGEPLVVLPARPKAPRRLAPARPASPPPPSPSALPPGR